jgi:hypothetical protein
MLQYLVGDPIKYRNAGLGWFRLSQILHDRTNGAFDVAFMRFAKLARPKVALPQSPLLTQGQFADVAAELRRDGVATLPVRLSPEDVRAITDFAYSTPAHGVDLRSNVTISPNNIPNAEGRYSWRSGDLIKVPEIQRLLCEGPFCAIAQEYIGCRPVLALVTLFLDPNYVGSYSPHIYHYDNDGPGFLKFFIYLTDAELGSGAHYFLKGTHRRAKPSRVARAGNYTDEELFSVYDRSQELVATAKAGTVIAEDTAGFHRGSTITRGHRLLMQFQFSVIDIPTDYDLRDKFAPVVVDGLHPGVAAITRKFFIDRRP